MAERAGYPSDLTDEQWELGQPALAAGTGAEWGLGTAARGGPAGGRQCDLLFGADGLSMALLAEELPPSEQRPIRATCGITCISGETTERGRT